MRTYLRPNQLDELRQEKANLEYQLSDPTVQEKGIVQRQLQRLSGNIDEQTPPDVAGPELDKVSKREKELTAQIREGMPSAEEMRRKPPGAVGRHIAWEKRNKPAILEWKNCRLILNKGSDDPDQANVETLRPMTSQYNLDGSLIEGKIMSFPSDTFKNRFPENMGPQREETEEQEVERLTRENAELRALVEERNQVDVAELAPTEEPVPLPDPSPRAPEAEAGTP